MYRLVQVTGWTLPEIDDAPSDLCDWLLRIDATLHEVRSEEQAKANRSR